MPMVNVSDFLGGIGLLGLRMRANVSQHQMAEAMGLPYRTYQALEYGQNKLKPVHLKALQTALIDLAVRTGDGSLIMNSETVRLAARLLDD